MDLILLSRVVMCWWIVLPLFLLDLHVWQVVAHSLPIFLLDLILPLRVVLTRIQSPLVPPAWRVFGLSLDLFLLHPDVFFFDVARCIDSYSITPGSSRLACRCSFSSSLLDGSNLAAPRCDVLVDCSSSLLAGSPRLACRCSFSSSLLA